MEQDVLKSLGLLDSESRVYVSLLNLGPSPAGKIASDTRLNRMSVYKALDSLIRKGLVSYVLKANRREFEAADPKALGRLLNEKETALKKIKEQLPDLEKLFHSTKKLVTANIFQGIKGAKAIWEATLDECKKGDVWLVLGAPKSAKILGGYFQDFNKRRAKKGVLMQIIYNQDAEELISARRQQPLTEVRVMPKEYMTPASIEIIQNRVLLVIYNPDIMVFSINSPETADSFRQYFKLLWKMAKK
ncbi:MAG: hypothetical protein KJ955_04460 [Nanoarchaeota archaeon]|nr:hypothetical protein [Nanoarchaeota archaeon]